MAGRSRGSVPTVPIGPTGVITSKDTWPCICTQSKISCLFMPLEFSMTCLYLPLNKDVPGEALPANLFSVEIVRSRNRRPGESVSAKLLFYCAN